MALCANLSSGERGGVDMTAIVYKEIKPSRLKIDALRLTLLNEMRKAGTAIKQDFEKTTATWSKKPRFEVQISLVGGPTVLVGTDDEIYGYVDRGTEPHEIWAGFYTGKSNKKTLAFASSSTPKTKPGVIRSFPGSRGKIDVFVPYVAKHPGTKARGFSKEIAKQWKPKFKRRMEKAMAQAAKASGHAL